MENDEANVNPNNDKYGSAAHGHYLDDIAKRSVKQENNNKWRCTAFINPLLHSYLAEDNDLNVPNEKNNHVKKSINKETRSVQKKVILVDGESKINM